jgi:predicted RNA methylase
MENKTIDFTNIYNKEHKKKNGVFYTPEDMSLFMSLKAKSIDDGKGIWLDPCCGVGILSITLASLQDDPIEFITNRLIINEIDKKQLKIALDNFKKKFGVEPKSYCEDYLKYDFNEDFIIMNPPYFKYKNRDIYAYFLDKTLKKTKGFVSINPMSFTNSIKYKNIRKLLLDYKSINLYHFDNIPGHIFDDAIIKVSVIVAYNGKNERKTTGLIRWKTEEREKMFSSLDQNLSNGILVEDIFYKTYPDTTKYIVNGETLKNYVVNNSEYPLYIANSPRYFISASTNRLDRTGQIKIYMKDLDSYNKALILLNSSYIYWWWRISDSSLSLTKKTLLMLPWIDVEYNDDVIRTIKNSESNNRVYKMNAGKKQENIKHPKDMITYLNSLFLDNNFINFHS